MLTLERIGAYPNLRRPGVVWAGPNRPSGAFAALCDAVAGVLAPIGVVLEARADAHVTLCRCGRDSRRMPRIDFTPREVHIAALTLFQSFLGPTGARYEPLAVFPFGGEDLPPD